VVGCTTVSRGEVPGENKLLIRHDGDDDDDDDDECLVKYSDLTGRKWREAREDCIMRSFITFTLHQILLG
jgi:hypothetical protein